MQTVEGWVVDSTKITAKKACVSSTVPCTLSRDECTYIYERILLWKLLEMIIDDL